MRRTVWGFFTAFSMSSLTMFAGQLALQGQVIAQGQDTATLNSAASPARGVSAGNTSYGWKWVDFSAVLGSQWQIRGLTATGGVLQVTAGLDQFSEHAAHTLYKQAKYDFTANQLAPTVASTKAPISYAGPYSLTMVQPAVSYAPQDMRILKNGKAAVAWPKGVSAYGSQMSPASIGNTVGTTWDNTIIGQSGQWLWIALKGPQYPVMRQAPQLVWRFRYWNRIMAINATTDQYRLYAIPRMTARESTWNTPPVFFASPHAVYIGVSHWVGRFPLNPDVLSSAPILARTPAPVLRERSDWMMAVMQAATRQGAACIASFWDDAVMRRSAPGVPGQPGHPVSSWLFDGAYFKRWMYPSDLVWAMNFPLAPETLAYKQRAALFGDIFGLLKNPLRGMWISATTAQIRAHFHNHPPALPGYLVKDGLYAPNSSAWPLPAGFQTYRQVRNAIAPVLAAGSAIPVWLPQQAGVDWKGWLDVKTYFDGGYEVAVSAGPRLPVNSPRIVSGNANLLFALRGQPAASETPASWAWNMNAAIPGATPQRVDLGYGVSGVMYAGKIHGQSAQSVAWREKGWTFSVPAAPGWPQSALTAARQIVSSLRNVHFAIVGGRAVFGLRNDLPSQAEFSMMNGRYLLYVTDWRAAAFASSMTTVSHY
ncbi:MAG: hypothetical protein ACYCYO_06195 [Bacilli bacterium]